MEESIDFFSPLPPHFFLFFLCPCASFSFVIKKSWKCWRSVPQPRRLRFMGCCRDDKLLSAKHNQEVASLNRCSSKRTHKVISNWDDYTLETRLLLFLLSKVPFLCRLVCVNLLFCSPYSNPPMKINGIRLSYWTPAATWKWNSPPALWLHTGPGAPDLYTLGV